MNAATSFVGIDFGTTNSAIATATPGREPALQRYSDGRGGTLPTFRTALYFDDNLGSGEQSFEAGGPAIRAFTDNDGEGRLVLSIKSHLASALFQRTSILGKSWTLEQLIGAFLRRMRGAADRDLGTRAVVGRPVHYWGAKDSADDDRAVARMRDALALAGFTDVVFEYEPVAAAATYAATLTSNELVLIGDFGGGTSDFCLLRVGPSVAPGDESAILATGGLGIGGDTFDGRIVDEVIAPMLGKGGQFEDEFGKAAPIPPWLFTALRRWHQLSFLRDKRTLALLERISRGAGDPAAIDRLRHIVEGELGLPLHQSVEGAKFGLSAQSSAPLSFSHPPVALYRLIERGDFETWIETDLDRLDDVIDDVLAAAGASASDVDKVFTTGGSSFVPAVRARLASRFSPDRLVGGAELTSVGAGLARRAEQLFG